MITEARRREAREEAKKTMEMTKREEARRVRTAGVSCWLSVARLLMMALLALLPASVDAQELTVVSFEASMNEYIDAGMQRRDYNGDICAIVKVQLPVEGAEFEGYVDFLPPEFKTNEYWVYMSPGKKYLKVKCPMRKTLTVYIPDYIGEGVSANRIYILDLSGYPVSGTVAPAAVEVETHQYLVLTVSPKNARVEIDGEEQAIDENGEGSYYLGRGMHTYAVSATGYAPQSGSVEIGDERRQLEISLESTMARLRLTCETPGVSFYVNEQRKGTGNWTGDLLAATYRVEARKDGYRARSRTVTLTERGEETIAFPALEEITGSLRVDYKPVNAEVWIDGEKAGLSPDRFSVMVGSHKVELRKAGYASKTESVSVKEGEETLIGGTLSKEAVAQSTSQSGGTSGTIAGHEYVDLGLSVKWATCNVGADSPEDYGDYYAWGETKTKSRYDTDNCETWEKQIGDIKGTSRDVAHVKWGGTWRLPTEAECDELLKKCTWTWTTQGGHAGYKVTGKNGNSIFLPAAGWRDGTSLYGTGSRGSYWSSTPFEGGTQDACSLYFYSGGRRTGWGSYRRRSGRSVRPVAGL